MARQRKDRKEKAGQAEVVAILDFVEALMVRRVPERTIIRAAAADKNLGARQTWRYIAKVRERWREEAKSTDRDERRDHMRKTLEDAYSRAIGTTATKPDSDVGAAVRVAKLMMDLDALATQPKQIVELTGLVGVGAASVPAATRDGLEAWLRGGPGKP